MIFATRTQPMKHISLAIVSGLIFAMYYSEYAQATANHLLVYQVQAGGVSAAGQEYVAIYNNSNQPADVTGWCVTYASASDISQTQLGCLKPPQNTTKLLLPSYQSFFLATTDFVQTHPGFTPDLVFPAGLAATSGHIKLLDPTKQVIDLVGWGAAVHPEMQSVAAPASGYVLQRHATTSVLKDSNNNAHDFYQTELTIPTTGSIYEEAVVISDDPMAVVTEIMPNATGADAGKEFIEIHNASDKPISLISYSLALGPAFTKLYTLPDVVLAPHSHRAFSDTETGMTLPNTSATIRLIDSNDRIASEVTYGELDEGMALAYIEGEWQQTYQPTPNAENIIISTKPCSNGQSREATNGECKTITLAASALPCKPNQTRNTETGRCRNINGVATVSAICKVGQEKNPATNRCRNIPASEVSKPCVAGQERNPETGRCKKSTALVAGSSSVKDVPSPLVTSNIKWWIAGAAALGAIGYGLYEWRHEVLGFTSMLKNKLVPS